jgi:hypothetical protein
LPLAAVAGAHFPGGLAHVDQRTAAEGAGAAGRMPDAFFDLAAPRAFS